MKNCPFLIKERQSYFPVEDSRGVSVARNKELLRRRQGLQDQHSSNG
ncbi:hypothetical protein AtNW77_Chr1g0047191 [Arabidopsis thaliana]